VVNDVKVSPVSNLDDGLRLRALRAIYGSSALGKYAIDPARPIRIIVDNGHISLFGTVNSQMDKTIAGLRANQLPGAFSVENNLVVENNSKQGCNPPLYSGTAQVVPLFLLDTAQTPWCPRETLCLRVMF
jgi:hypothetical protein